MPDCWRINTGNIMNSGTPRPNIIRNEWEKLPPAVIASRDDFPLKRWCSCGMISIKGRAKSMKEQMPGWPGQLLFLPFTGEALLAQL